MVSDESRSFLDLETGKVETVSLDLLSTAEESDEQPELPQWQKKEWEIVNRIVSTERYLRLPTKFDVHEWEIVRDFCYSVESGRVREDLLDAIHGTGAFRSFKFATRRHGIQEDWFAFRANALKEIAIRWCKEHKLEFVE